MKEKGWKITAIVFIALFVIETLLFIWLIGLGLETVGQENECAYNICDSKIYESYYYDEYSEVCYCFSDGEIEYQKYIG